MLLPQPLQSSRMSNKPRSEMAAWKALANHHQTLKGAHMRDWFAADSERFNHFHIAFDDVLFDFSKHKITAETVDLLAALAMACDVEKARDDLFSGKNVNKSENRPALHTALRARQSAAKDYVDASLEQIEKFSKKIRSDRNITDVLVLGIGGSINGPKMVCEALAHLADGPQLHFLGNIEGDETSRFLETLKPKSTIVVIVSKTFSTLETMANAVHIKDVFERDNLYAVTENTALAESFQIHKDNIFPLKDWIGGRYSVWSAVGLPIALSIGFKNYMAFLEGARAADSHFLNTPLSKNIPVLMALLGVWYRNFWHYPAHAVLPYCGALKSFPSYIQQLDMESNGKSVSREGEVLNYTTSPIVFGDVGTECQHSFFQHLHQGSDITPADFLVFKNAHHGLKTHHNALVANALAQAQALMQGDSNEAEPYRTFEGNRPSTLFLVNTLSPHSLGLMMALYEHKVFVQGVIWNVESFDQWGVELGKSLAKNILHSLNDSDVPEDVDCSTAALISAFKQKNS